MQVNNSAAKLPTGFGRLRDISGLNLPFILAPMVGLSHVALRELLQEYLPPGLKVLWPTEMLNSRRLPHEKLGTTPETLRSDRDIVLNPQILGNEAGPIARSVKKLEEWGAGAIDINMGCPVQRALKHNYGVALMGDADYAARVVDMAVRCTDLPVSVKLRAVRSEAGGELLSFVRGLVNAGASWVTLHPRTAEMQRRGRAEWGQIRELVENISIPVIGNGDIQEAADVHRMIDLTGCAAVMAGRVLTAKPWMVWQIAEDYGFPAPVDRTGKAPRTTAEESDECRRAVLRMGELCELHFTRFGEDLALRKFRFYIKNMSPWLLFGHDLYSRSTRARNFVELRQQLEQFFSVPQIVLGRTELRQ